MRAVQSLLLAGLILGGAAACSPLRGHQGYIIDADLVNSVQPGVDNRQSVQSTLGRPTFTGQFDQSDWYYVSRDTRNLAFNNPHVNEQVTLRISFDPSGVVKSIGKAGVEQVASIDPYGRTTPTLGKKKNFFSELFGNIGAVGAGGGGPGGGGGSDEP